MHRERSCSPLKRNFISANILQRHGDSLPETEKEQQAARDMKLKALRKTLFQTPQETATKEMDKQFKRMSLKGGDPSSSRAPAKSQPKKLKQRRIDDIFPWKDEDLLTPQEKLDREFYKRLRQWEHDRVIHRHYTILAEKTRPPPLHLLPELDRVVAENALKGKPLRPPPRRLIRAENGRIVPFMAR